MKRLSCILLAGILLVACSGGADSRGRETINIGNRQKYYSETSEDYELGSRKNPLPLNTEARVGSDWNIAILEINPDAWPIVQKENQFNSPPREGNKFIMARVKVSYVGEESGTPWVNLRLRYLGAGGNTYNSGIGVLPDSLSNIGEQFPGAYAEAYIGWELPSDAINGGSIIVEETFSFNDTRVFFKGVE